MEANLRSCERAPFSEYGRVEADPNPVEPSGQTLWNTRVLEAYRKGSLRRLYGLDQISFPAYDLLDVATL